MAFLSNPDLRYAAGRDMFSALSMQALASGLQVLPSEVWSAVHAAEHAGLEAMRRADAARRAAADAGS
jgi:hypothetical protein